MKYELTLWKHGQDIVYTIHDMQGNIICEDVSTKDFIIDIDLNKNTWLSDYNGKYVSKEFLINNGLIEGEKHKKYKIDMVRDKQYITYTVLHWNKETEEYEELFTDTTVDFVVDEYEEIWFGDYDGYEYDDPKDWEKILSWQGYWGII